MTRKTIFDSKGIVVTENYYPYSPDLPEYRIIQGDIDFGVWEKPKLEYASLKRQIADYIEERDRSLMEDVENEDLDEEFNDNVNLWGMDAFE